MPTIAEARTPALLFGSLVVIALLLTERRSLREELSSARTALQQDEQAQEPQLQTNDSGNRRLQRVDTATWTLEDLAFYYGTDKSHDDHKYVDVYESIFGPLRFSTVNFTEIGVAMGQSLQMWHDYFPNAHVWGVDIHPLVIKAAKKLFAQQPRVHILAANSKSNVKVPALGLAPESMDIVIDDALHEQWANEIALEHFWPLVKPGGFYIIEDMLVGALPWDANHASQVPTKNFDCGVECFFPQRLEEHPFLFDRFGHLKGAHAPAVPLEARTKELLRHHDWFWVVTGVHQGGGLDCSMVIRKQGPPIGMTPQLPPPTQPVGGGGGKCGAGCIDASVLRAAQQALVTAQGLQGKLQARQEELATRLAIAEDGSAAKAKALPLFYKVLLLASLIGNALLYREMSRRPPPIAPHAATHVTPRAR